MAQKAHLSPKHHQAALLVAEDEMTDEQIAERVGIGRRTLTRWKDDPAFAARVEEIRQKIAQRILSVGIARRENRVKAIDKRHRAFEQIVAERAAAGLTDRRGNPVPGSSTGYVLQKIIPSDAGMIYEYVTDTATSAEMRALEKQVAQEVGDWTEKRDVTSGGEKVDATPSVIFLLPQKDNPPDPGVPPART